MMELMELMEMTCWRVVSLEEKGTGDKEERRFLRHDDFDESKSRARQSPK